MFKTWTQDMDRDGIVPTGIWEGTPGALGAGNHIQIAPQGGMEAPVEQVVHIELWITRVLAVSG